MEGRVGGAREAPLLRDEDRQRRIAEVHRRRIERDKEGRILTAGKVDSAEVLDTHRASPRLTKSASTAKSYGEYLQLTQLLTAQKPLSFEHDEMMFIIVHQVSELWMRLMRHELEAVLTCVRKDDLDLRKSDLLLLNRGFRRQMQPKDNNPASR